MVSFPTLTVPGARRRPWRLHFALVVAAGALAGAVALFDLAGGGRGAFIDLSGAVAAFVGLSWGVYAALSTALARAWGTSADRVVLIHVAALVAGPALVFAGFAAWMAIAG